MVYPSGSDLATASVPVLPLAPGLFSTTKGWPSFVCIRSARMRPMLSGVDPGANGTMIRTFRVGHVWASVAEVVSRTREGVHKRTIFLENPDLLVKKLWGQPDTSTPPYFAFHL